MSGFEGLLAGRVLADRYLVEKVIGRGGMGAVYRALDQRLGRPVAVKVIMVPGVDAATHERLRQRFLREAQAAARLRHPHVVTVHDFGTDEALGLDYLVMELLEGSDLASRMADGGRLPAAAALAVVSQAARGLAAGHRAGMVHRDVKPGNLFLELDEHGEVHVRILDFGIAQVAFDSLALTVVGRDPLSPTYAAPEQLRGSGLLTPAADVFSLAAVALFLLNGQRPFSGQADLQASEADAALDRLSAVPEVTPAVRDVLRRALAIYPERRWPDANAFHQALEAARGTGSDTLRASVMTGTAAASAADADDTTLFAAAGEQTLHAPARTPAPAPAGPETRAGSGERTPAGSPYTAAARARRRGMAPAPRRSLAPAIAAGILALGALAVIRPWESDAPAETVATSTADSATLESFPTQAEADSLLRIVRQESMIQAAVDSARRADSLARESKRLAQEGAGPAPAEDDGVYALEDVERLPQARNMGDVTRYLRRNYPPLLRDAGVEGEVVVSFVIDADGRPDPRTLQVTSSSHPGFDETALRAVERTRFEPAQVGGRNVRVRALLPIRFQVAM